ncbi:hypothetical protein SAMN05421780_104273 [Flexibacter flexilis DSM 6793]|uniref:Uncharacterized protein n=1 Tax=Flexibacter flexilis DSM 6793 TaxID=927664 RepID=A0A1I1I9V6_9BACT|nr:hypothetical protein [Flexibacter flexilis]SFC32801.1 hypothetical protein SAMN05421780_104273 [Flexibacter flexilis DSM 6793]
MTFKEELVPLSQAEKEALAAQQRKAYIALVAYALVASVGYFFVAGLPVAMFVKGMAAFGLSAVAMALFLWVNKTLADSQQQTKRVVIGQITAIEPHSKGAVWILGEEKIIIGAAHAANFKVGQWACVAILPKSKQILSVTAAEPLATAEPSEANPNATAATQTENPKAAISRHTHTEPLTPTDKDFLEKQKQLILNQNLIAALLWGVLTFFVIKIIVRFLADNSPEGRWAWASDLLPALAAAAALWFSYKQFARKYDPLRKAIRQNKKKVVTTYVAEKQISNKDLEPHYTLQGHLSVYKNYLKIDGNYLNVSENIYQITQPKTAAQLHFASTEHDEPFLLVLDLNGQKKAFFLGK